MSDHFLSSMERKLIIKLAKNPIERYLSCVNQFQISESKEREYGPIKNILLFNTIDKIGGAAKVCERTTHFLNDHGFQAYMYVHRKFFENTIVSTLPSARSFDQIILNLFQKNEGWLDVFLSSSLKIKQLPEFKSADLLHFHNMKPGFFSVLTLPEITSLKPIIWTLHDMHSITGHCNHSYECDRWKFLCGSCPNLNSPPEINRDSTGFLIRLKKLAYDHSDFHVVSPSNWLKSKISKSILKHKSITVIPNGIDENIFAGHSKEEARKKLNLPGDHRILLFVAFRGIKNRIKGGHLIPEIIKRLKQKKTIFICVGAPGIQEANIISVDSVTDERKLALFYAAADLFIYPSFADNFPLVILESLSCRTPVVAFKTGGIPEIIKHKYNGYLSPTGNIDEMIHGINYFLADRLRLEKAEYAARKTILDKFTLKDTMNKYIHLYHSVKSEFYTHSFKADKNYRQELYKLIFFYYSRLRMSKTGKRI